MALSLGSGDFRGGNVFKLGDTLLEVFPFQREERERETAKLPSIMFSPRCRERASDLIVTSPALYYAGKNGKYATSVRPLLKKPAPPAAAAAGNAVALGRDVGNLSRDFTRVHVFIPTGAGGSTVQRGK